MLSLAERTAVCSLSRSGLRPNKCRALAEFPELEVTYREDCGDFIVTLQRKTETDGENDGKMDVQKDVQKEVQIELTERQLVILKIIKENDTITLAEMSKRMKMTSKTIQRELDWLKKYHFLSRVEGRRYGHWVLTMPRLPKV